MALGEAFTVLAVFEAIDKISSVVERMDAVMDGFSETATRTAEAASVAGAKIDESLLQTASGADAVELADAKLAAAQQSVAAATEKQAAAERALLDAQAQAAAAADGDTAATERLAAAGNALADAQKKSALAAKEASAAQQYQADVQRATVLATDEGKAAADAAAAAQERQALVQKQAADGGAMLQKGMALAALGVAAVGYESVKAAGNFESMTEHLVTDAGESQQNIGMIRSGMLALATTTGTTTDQMAAGMYHIESAGFHGTQALDVLKTAAEGAKVGGADLDTIGQALTGTMNAFGPSAGTATQMMNAMIATVGAGDMKMQDLGSSLGNVAAIAASAGLQYSQVGGAIATMTAQNVTAQRATQDLAHTISSLSNPTAVQVKEMTAMGINSTSLANNLGKAGLTGTFDQLVQAIANNTKGGSVFVTSLNASKAAGAQAQQILAQMPPTMAKVAQSWQAGTTSTADFTKAVNALPPAQKLMYTQFESLTKKSSDFATSLQANTPMAQTFNASLAKMTGGTTSLNTILMLSGQHAGAFAGNVKTIGDAASKSGSSVDNWDKIQGTFNQKMDVAKASMEAAGISIGTVLLPVVSKVASVITAVVGPMATWIAAHQKWVGLALAVAGAITVMVAAMKAWEIVQAVINGLTAIFAAEETAILSPIELAILAIAGLAAGLYYAWTHFATFREVVIVALQAVKNAAVDVWHALETAWNAIANAAVSLWHSLESAWDSVTGAVKAVGKALSDTWNAIWSTVTSVWNAISGFFEKWWPLLLVIFLPPIALLLAIWNHFHQDIEDAAKTTWNAILDFFKTAWAVIKDVASDVWFAIKLTIILPMQELWQLLVSLWNTASSWLSSAWKAIVAAAESLWAPIKSHIVQPLTDAWHDVVDVADKIGSAITNALTSAKNTVMGIVHDFESVGSDIVNGIVSGVSGAAHLLTDKLKGLANDALKAAKSFLGISSPSKVFADQVGQWIPAGIAQGVAANAGAAHAAVQTLAGNLPGLTPGVGVPGLAGGFAGGGGLSYAPAASSAGPNVYIDLRNSQVLGAGAMNQLAQTIGKQLTGQLAPAGVHIRG